MKTVVRQIALQQAFVIYHGAEVVEIDAAVLGGVVLDPAIEFEDLCGRTERGKHLRALGVVVHGEHRRQYDMHAVDAREFCHGLQVAFDLSQRHRTRVPGDVVSTGKNDDGFGPQIDDVRPEANQHLRRSLSANAAIDVGLAGEVLLELPDVGDRVAHENDACLIFRRGSELGVGFAIATEVAEVVHPKLDQTLAVLLEVLNSIDRVFGGLLCDCKSGEQGQYENSKRDSSEHFQNISPEMRDVSGNDVPGGGDLRHEFTCQLSLRTHEPGT